MKKTEANVRLLVETVVARETEDTAIDFDVEAFVRDYLAGDTETFEPETDEEADIFAVLEEALHNEFDRYEPTENEQWEANAPKITVKIGDKEYQTFLDKHGVQRFCGNTVISYLMSGNDRDGKLSLNTLALEYHRGKFSSGDWLDFMTSFGYSVSGLMDLSAFTYLPIENPLWETED